MRVTKGNKVLWHIQNMNIHTDGEPYDMFVWAENEPSPELMKRAFLEDYTDASDELINEWLTSSDVYAVYVEEVEE